VDSLPLEKVKEGGYRKDDSKKAWHCFQSQSCYWGD